MICEFCAEELSTLMSPPDQASATAVRPPAARLDKGLYGLVQSGRRWNEQFNKNLLSWGFKASAADPCLYVKSKGDSEIRVLLFVDDMAIMSDTTPDGLTMKKELIQAVKDEGYECSFSDDDDVYLGMAVKRVNETALFLTQERYVRDVMLKFGFSDSKKTLSPAPGASGKVSARDCPVGDPKHNADGTRFREICGVLRWIETCTAPISRLP